MKHYTTTCLFLIKSLNEKRIGSNKHTKTVNNEAQQQAKVIALYPKKPLTIPPAKVISIFS